MTIYLVVTVFRASQRPNTSWYQAEPYEPLHEYDDTRCYGPYTSEAEALEAWNEMTTEDERGCIQWS